MNSPLEPYRLRFTPGPFRHRLFEGPDAAVEAWFLRMWNKYRGELMQLAESLQARCVAMKRAGHHAAFGDVEGELLYILVREFQPHLIYEISPNSGFSTNYLLAAVQRNGRGRVEGFEIMTHCDGRPIDEVIRGNLIDDCRDADYHLNIGDARITALDRLRHGTPDLVFLDSCHDDFFAEFYLKELLPRCRGIAFVQDIAHYDPRPEYATEAYYVLSHTQETASRFLSVGIYEDRVNASGLRDGLRPRRPIRSNSVVFRLPDQPECTTLPDQALAELVRAEGGVGPLPCWSSRLGSLPLNAARVLPGVLAGANPAKQGEANGRYVDAWFRGRLQTTQPGLIDLLALRERRAALDDGLVQYLDREFAQYDLFCQVLILEVLTTFDRREPAIRLLTTVDSAVGPDLAVRVARVAWSLGCPDLATERLRAACQSVDLTVAVGFRNLLAAAALYSEMGQAGGARAVFRKALDHIGQRLDPIQVKASREVFAFCLRHPRFLPLALDSRLRHQEWLTAGFGLLRSAVRRLQAARYTRSAA